VTCLLIVEYLFQVRSLFACCLDHLDLTLGHLVCANLATASNLRSPLKKSVSCGYRTKRIAKLASKTMTLFFQMTSTTGGTAVYPVESFFSGTILTCKKTATHARAPMAHARAQRWFAVRPIAGIRLVLAAAPLVASASRKRRSTASVPLVVDGPSVKAGQQTLNKATLELVTKCVFLTVQT